MAIKKRLLLNLRSIYVSLGMISRDKPRGMHSLLQRLLHAQSLCKQGLSETAYKKYEEVYDGLIMVFRQLQFGEASGDVQEIFSLCIQLLDHIMEETNKEEGFKKEIVLIISKGSISNCHQVNMTRKQSLLILLIMIYIWWVVIKSGIQNFVGIILIFY